ncbi:hypothetical protein PIB30_069940 [Stylosanthes scabra]|uniref:Uncharacterized protein n=1 Tax=Stylosanthes scabra TaxID=79078 RepID=A0ABU6WRC8_9FABA|nr:hypothetical protein [Stylosanthes scabra]
MCPFFFDSKLFFAGGSFDSTPLSSKEIYQLSYAGGATLDIAEVEEAAGTIPEPLTLLYNCYVTNIQGEVHLMVHDALLDDREMGFWVLRSKKWHPLPLPPTLRNYYAKAAEDPKRNYVRYICWQCFTWKDKLFLLVGSDPAERKSPKDAFNFYVYNPQHDPQDDPWQQRTLFLALFMDLTQPLWLCRPLGM